VRVCLDRNHQAVFFTPRGKALFDVPQTSGLNVSAETSRPGVDRSPPQLPADHRGGASRWKRDSEIPWAMEARAWEALDSG